MSSDAASTFASVLRVAAGEHRGRLAAVLAITVVAIGGVSVHRYVTLERELTEAVLARRAAIGSLAATALADKFERLVDVGIALATRVRFQELVAAGRWNEAGQILRRVPEDFEFLDRLLVTDVRGTLMADVPEVPEVRGTNFAHRDWFKGVSRSWKPYVSHLYRRTAAPQRNVIAASVPIRGPGDSVAGILVLQVKLETFLDWVRSIELGPESRVLVVDNAWQSAFDSQSPAGAQIEDIAADPLVKRLAPGAPQAQVVRDAASGRDLVFGHAPAAHGWGVVTMQSAAAAFAARDALLRQLLLDGALIALGAVAAIVLGTQALLERRRTEAERAHSNELRQAQEAVARHGERLRILHDIDRALIAEVNPEAIAAAVLQPLRELLGVPRVVVNIFDLAAGEVEWLAAAGRRRTRVGPGVRYSIRLMGDVEALRRGEPQRIDVHALPPGPEVEALLASGVHVYMAVPMIAAGELLGALSFGGEQSSFPEEQITIAQEVANQLAIAIAQAKLFERVRRHAEELEQRVSERTSELQIANRELEAFSYSVSHDLRAPLRAVDGFSRILQEEYGGRLDDEGRRLLGIVRGNSRKMGELIDDLLEFSRLGRKPLSTAKLDMKRVAENALEEFRVAGGRPPKVTWGVLPSAHGDTAVLQHVWMNLLGNAIKFSSKREHPVIEVSGYENGAECVYCVRDNGVGFDMQYYNKLFGVFQRLHGMDEFPGTGVGLAIVKRVIARHGGRVWAEGKVDEGAVFYFSLPRGKQDGQI